MARKSEPGTLIHCEYCGEDFSATYKRCPFCGEKPSANAPEIAPKARDGKLEDDFVFEGADLFDEPAEDAAAEDGSDTRGGKRVRAGKGAGAVNWTRLVTFGCSLVIIVAALIIVFAYIYPKIHGTKTPAAGADASPSASLPASSAPSEEPSSSPSQEPSAPVEPEPSAEPAPSSGVEGELMELVLNKDEFTLRADESYEIKATVKPSTWGGTVEWSSSNNAIAKVDANGKVTNVNTGKSVLRATITATAGEKSATVTVYCRPGSGDTGATGTEDSAFAAGDVCIVDTTSLNVRSGPSKDYRKLGSLKQGAQVKIVAVSDGGWYQIEYDGGEGYVSGDYLKKK